MSEDKKKAEAAIEKPSPISPTKTSPSGLRTLIPAPLLTPAFMLVTGILLIVITGIAQRVGWISAGGAAVSSTATSDQTFTCAMHPQIRQPGPGRCPICGMELVPAALGGGADLDDLSIRIEPAQRRLANIATAKAKRETVSATIQTVGAIAIDESRMATISSYIDGRLERLFADYTGVDVAEGDHLAVIYSPELYSAQVEYIETRKAVRQMNSAALASVRAAQEKLTLNSRQRLVELGLTETQIAELEESDTAKSRLTIFSPMGGTVIEKFAVEGKYVKAGEPIYRVADLSTVWLMLELYPEDAARIRYGQRVAAKLQSLPGEVFDGRVAFLDPQVDAKKRTVGVRVEFLNTAGDLRPGDYANATIYLPIGQEGQVFDADMAGRWISPMHPQIIRDTPGPCPICGMDLVPTSKYGYSDVPVAQPTSLYVPRSAVLMAGSNSVVYVEAEPGRFEIRPIVLGPILRDKVIVLDGIEEGEQVATAGNFLIDSQMQLAGKPSLIDPTRAVVRNQEPGTGKEPLEFGEIHVTTIAGEAGQNIESLFTAYFGIQRSLASDKKPNEADANELHRLAVNLASHPSLPATAREQLSEVAEHSEHIHHLDMNKARLDAFRPLSHAIITLATLVRGERATTTFHHMFCHMVEGVGGDWLQASDQLRNPYWGAEMLKCGREVREIAVKGPGVGNQGPGKEQQ